MNIRLIAIGKTDEKALQILIEKYAKRIGFYINFEILTLPDIKNSKHLNFEQQKQKEGDLLQKHIQKSDMVVLLDEKGQSYTSVQFSEFIAKKMLGGTKQLVFVIGGPYGFSQEIYNRYKQRISLSKMTFSHQMVRLFFVEQLYRAFSILKNEPYHHE